MPIDAAEPAQGRLVVGQDVRAPQLVQLDPVLEGAEERVGLVELLAVLAADVAALA